MKIQIKILIGLLLLAQASVGATYLLSFLSGGLAAGFGGTMFFAIFATVVGVVINWEEVSNWDAERKTKKTEPQTPPKGDWK